MTSRSLTAGEALRLAAEQAVKVDISLEVFVAAARAAFAKAALEKLEGSAN